MCGDALARQLVGVGLLEVSLLLNVSVLPYLTNRVHLPITYSSPHRPKWLDTGTPNGHLLLNNLAKWKLKLWKTPCFA